MSHFTVVQVSYVVMLDYYCCNLHLKITREVGYLLAYCSVFVPHSQYSRSAELGSFVMRAPLPLRVMPQSLFTESPPKIYSNKKIHLFKFSTSCRHKNLSSLHLRILYRLAYLSRLSWLFFIICKIEEKQKTLYSLHLKYLCYLKGSYFINLYYNCERLK